MIRRPPIASRTGTLCPYTTLSRSFLTLIAAARIVTALKLGREEGETSTRKLEIVYEMGAFSYALVFGMIAAATVVLDAPADVEVLMVANALCYGVAICARNAGSRSEEHTSELQSLMRISYAVFCLKKKKKTNATYNILTVRHT